MGNDLKASVTVLLPVYNAQERLSGAVGRILDVLPELVDRFDVLIVDDGSTDDTIDVARQLAVQFPQVAAVRHPVRLGLTESVQTGLDHTDGEIVIVGDEQHGVDPEDLRKLWPLRGERGLVMAHLPPAGARPTPWFEKLMTWKSKRGQTVAGVQMIRRSEIDDLRRLESLSTDRNRRVDQPAAQASPRPLSKSPQIFFHRSSGQGRS
jgi:glycosyltransferase involved in cell wall biosynthesis